MERNKTREQADAAASSSSFTELPECSTPQESSTEPPASSHLLNTDLVNQGQVEQFVEAETYHLPDQEATIDAPLISELVHSASAQGIVIVREEAHISGNWSEVHLNQSYLVQQEDGTVCEAAVVNELSSELSAGQPKLYGESIHSDIEIESQPVEVYEICGLVEEVAEETICVSSSAQMPSSPGYEVNLFNALLDHSEEYTDKEGLDLHLGTSLHTINESGNVIITQQPFLSSHDTNVMEVCSNDISHISTQNTITADIGQHLVLDANQVVEVAESGSVCVVQAAVSAPDSFTIKQTDSSAQTLAPSLQTVPVVSDQTEVQASHLVQTLEAEAKACSSSLISAVEVVTVEEMGIDSSLAVSLQVSEVENQLTPKQSHEVAVTKPEICVSLREGTKDNLNLIEPPSQNIKKSTARETKPEAPCPTSSSCVINPKLLIPKPGETPLLKYPPSALGQVSKQQNVVSMLVNAHCSGSGTVIKECLPQTILAADSVFKSVAGSSQKDQAQSSVHITSSTTPPTKAQPPSTADIPSPLCQLAPALSSPLQNKSDKEALIVTKASTGKADTAPKTVLNPKDTNPPSKPRTLDVLSASLEGASKAPDSSSSKHAVSQLDSFCQSVVEESVEMEQDGPQESAPGHASSSEEGSDEDAELYKSECGIATPSSTHKVRQWIADRVTVSSSPVSPGTSSPSPAPSSTRDWLTPRRERASPLRGPTGRFLSPSSLGPAGYSSSSSPADQATAHRTRGERRTDMAELAKHEADIEHRTQALKREGFWSMKRLTRLTEPVRPKVHWDYLCEEMQWLSADFAQERRWKRGVARKVVRMVMRHHEELRQKEEKAKRDEHAKIRRVASSIAKEVRAFWSSVEKVVQYKQQSRLEEKRKKALDLQLDFIVGQTEKYSDLLSQSLAPTRPAETVPSPAKKALPSAVDEDDRDFEPQCEEEDDEETIEVEEQQEGNDAESRRREIELLKEEGMLPLDQLLSTLKLPQEFGSEEECSDETSSSVEEEDGEFTANEEDAEDEEDTIAAQEKVEGNVNHAEELDDLAREGDMSIEELLEKYKGAYASDFEEPSASASKSSSESEVSGDEEEETEEDESDVESNTSSSDSPEDSEEDEDDDSEKEEESEEEEDNGDEDDSGDEGMEVLLKEGDNSPPSTGSRPKKEISHIAATAESLQPKGYTLATTKVKTPIPFLLHGTLREYQHIGLDWLVTMYEKKLNGILADEMGLGKTIQTIALLAHLACVKGNWGPHLIIVPTSVMLNWEMELKRWCPGFKILTYFGSQKERKLKRQGWTKPNAFHVCITSYKLVLQDHQAFRRKSWRYLILDEAQNIKNFKSQRWQSLLNFNSHRRLLLTGTPLQNSLMELWSLMHFLMPHVFQSHREFKEWFSNPLTGMIEGSQEYNEGLIKRLHKVLRPFLLRRIKADVEKQMPKKYEHVVRCRLSKRQRFLYDDFMAQASTRETLASGHFMSVINILMQLRKVCNHPNLFDPRPIQSPFITQPIVFHTASLVQDALEVSPFKRCDLSVFDLIGLEGRVSRYQADVFLPHHKVSRQLIQEIVESPEPPPRPKPVRMKVNRMFQPPPKADSQPVLLMNKPTCPVTPAPQTPKPAMITEVAPPPAPVVQQVVCSVAPTPPRLPVHSPSQTAVRSSAPKPVPSIRPSASPSAPSVPASAPSNVMPQRVLLSPDMQARLPSGEVVSIAQLASLAGRPVSSCQGSKPVTFQLQGNKLTLSGAQIHQVPVAPPRPVQGNLMQLVSSGGQHHLISQPAQVAVLGTTSTHPVNTSPTPSGTQLPLNTSSQVPSSMVSSPGIVKIVVRQAAGKEGGPVPTLAVAPSPRVTPQPSPSPHPHSNAPPVRNPAPPQIPQRTPGPATAHYTIAPPKIPGSTSSQPQPPRPVLKVVQPPPASTEQPAPARVSSSSSSLSSSKSSVAPRDDGSSSKMAPPLKSGSSAGAKSTPRTRVAPRPPPRSPFYMSWLEDRRKQQRDSRLDMIVQVNERHCGTKPIYGQEVLDLLTFLPGSSPSPAPLGSLGQWGRSGHGNCLLAQSKNKANYWLQSHALREAIHSTEGKLELLSDIIDRFTFVIPPVEAPPISMHCCHPPPSLSHKQSVFSSMLSAQLAPLTDGLHRIQCNMRTHFPDLRLIQYDCGKLQTLHTLLRKLKAGGHRVLIFTQMTRMLDVLEQFLNYHGHIYLRLDGSTRVEQRQALMERFNADRRIFCFILSTRSGGVGVNLTGADTVVFYDSDWNPTMDAQAQDRCHRIGQTRDVHIYRLISERTVEENILKKANQKRMLGDMAIEGGNFTTAFFKEQTIRELFDVNDGEKREVAVELSVPQAEEEESGSKQSTTILEQALCRAEDEEDIVAASQAKAEQVAELAEFNENIPLDDGGEQEEVEELSKAEQEIAALVEQLTPIERYAMNFLEASLEDVCKEELKQAEEQVEAARKGLDQAKEEGLKLHASSEDDDDDFSSPASVEPVQPTPARRGRKPKDKSATSTRSSCRLRGASPEPEPNPPTLREVPERLRFGLRGRGAAKDTSAAFTATSSSTTAAPARSDHPKTSSKIQDFPKPSKASSPARDHQNVKTRTLPSRSLPSPVPSNASTSPPGGKPQTVGETDSRSARRAERENEQESGLTILSPESTCPVDHQLYSAQARDDDSKEQGSLSPPLASSRSPRKRQSADGEVLRGLSEDSPSAKVLRKLPGRLVTVVEEKEPRRIRRRGSGTGGQGSSEETMTEEHMGSSTDEPSRDSMSQSPDSKTKGTLSKLVQDQDSNPNLPALPQPVRGYPPYSPPHLSPDMPVLRNLPVRRRLETESRMAAQLGEHQQQHLGRGRGGNQSRKVDIPPGKDTTSTEPNVNSIIAPVKRKRGRPPKIPQRLPEPERLVSPPAQPISIIEEVSPRLSPKRKRGRPRKDMTAGSDAVGAEQSANNAASMTTGGVSDPPTKTAAHKSESVDANTEPRVLPLSTIPESQPLRAAVVSTVEPSLSATAEEAITKTTVPAQFLATTPNPSQGCTSATDQASTPTSAQASSPKICQTKIPTPPPPATALPTAVPSSASAQVASSASIPGPATTSAHVSSAPSTSLPTPATVPVTDSPNTTAFVVQLPAATTISTTVPAGKPTLGASADSGVHVESKLTAPPTEKTTILAPTKTATVTKPASTVLSKSSPEAPCTTGVSAVIIPAPATTAETTNLLPLTTASAKLAPTTSTTIVKNNPPDCIHPPAEPRTPNPVTITLAQTTSTPSTALAKPGSTSSPVAAVTLTTSLKTVKATTSTQEKSVLVSTTTSAKSVSATSAPLKSVAAASSSSSVNEVTELTTGPPRTTITTTKAPAKLITISSTAKTVTAITQAPMMTVTPTTTSLEKSIVVASTAPSPVPTKSATITSTASAKAVTATTLAPTEGVRETTPPASTRTVEMTPSKQVITTTLTSTVKTVIATTTFSVTSATSGAVATVTMTTATTSTPSTSNINATTVPTNTITVAKSSPVRTIVPLSLEVSSTVSTTKTVSHESGTHSLTVTPSSVLNSTTTEVPQGVLTTGEKQPLPKVSTPAPSSGLEKESTQKKHAPNEDSQQVMDMEVDVQVKSDSGTEGQDKKQEIDKSQPKKRKVESLPEAKDSAVAPALSDSKTQVAAKKAEAEHQEIEESIGDEKELSQKRPLSRQSSQESARSSSASSECSTSTLTRHAHHKRTYENRHPPKRRRVDVTSQLEKEEDGEKRGEGKEEISSTSQKRRSRSSSSSSESDNSENRKERRLTRSAKHRLQDQEQEGECNRHRRRTVQNIDRNNTTSTGGESGSDTSSVRITRKSAGSQPTPDSKPQTNSVPSAPPEPEVLGKRCSALNAAAKLLAMKGRVDTPGHTTRKDSGAKTTVTSPASSDKSQKPKSKNIQTSPQTNSVNLSNNKFSSSKPSMPAQSSRSISRSTRQCPGSLVPPLAREYKRGKPEERDKEKERGNKKKEEGKEAEGEAPSSRGQSACSSISSDCEGDNGGRSSRSRSSSNSSQRTPSVCSQSTGPRESHSRATSSERERDRSSERAKHRDRREGQAQESRKDNRRSQRLSQEVGSSSGNEGTPDRVLRSVAALAAVQARSPAASTRSSSGQHRHNKT
ncbi:helicase SRCAP [Lampris incognitus]|uniref:helicase SRCAP n=1 Tax=Lampris incognitus TaxID=2546036 RepID=UPI0024B49CFC|nr:helicase SRCAP [Lampris incognitus]